MAVLIIALLVGACIKPFGRSGVAHRAPNFCMILDGENWPLILARFVMVYTAAGVIRQRHSLPNARIGN